MELYETENEQLDAVRGFLRDNGKSIVVGVVIALAGLFGWRYWNNHQIDTAMQSSTEYDRVMISLLTGQNDVDTKVANFIQSNKNSYGVMAAIQAAQYKVNASDYLGAEKLLLEVQKLTTDENLLSLINLRLVRIQTELKQTDAALHSLSLVKGTSWIIQAHELRGDIYLAAGDFDAAKGAYVQAMGLNPSQSTAQMLQIKLNNIAG